MNIKVKYIKTDCIFGEEMYCDNCGAKNRKNRLFCKNCGAAVRKVKPADYLKAKKKSDADDENDPYQPTPPPLPIKSVLIAIVLSLCFFPGLGHLYARKLGRGMLYFMGFLVVMLITIFVAIDNSTTISYVMFILLGILYLWISIDAVFLVRRYNKFLDKNLRAPKKKEKW